MRTLTIIAGAIGILAGGAQGTYIPQMDMVLTVDYYTGAATLKNVGTVRHRVYVYYIRSADAVGNLNPGTRASYDDDGNIFASSPGTWLAISDSIVTNFAPTIAALSASVASYGPINPTATSLGEGTPSGGYANFKANSATVWSIGNPVLPGKASLSDLAFYWREIGMTSGDTYVGQIVITPEPATLLALLAAVPVLAGRKGRTKV